MLRYSYKDPLGRVSLKNSYGTRFVANIYRANCIFAIVWRKRQLIGFAVDFKHLERCFKGGNCYDNFTNWIIYPNAWDKKDLKKLLTLFIKYKIRFTIKYNK